MDYIWRTLFTSVKASRCFYSHYKHIHVPKKGNRVTICWTLTVLSLFTSTISLFFCYRVHYSFFHRFLVMVNFIMLASRWDGLPVSKGVQLRTRFSHGQLLRPEGAAASCAPAEVCVWAWGPSPGRPRVQPRAEDLFKVRGQRWSSASRSNLSAQRPASKTKITQVRDSPTSEQVYISSQRKTPDEDELQYVSDLISAT